MTTNGKTSEFAEHYQSVLNNPDGTDHQNIRQFMAHGWPGVVFEGKALLEK
ncbi:HopJ type III effector protein [Paraflavitalea devenefica]|uniref:HopJ type III effector protein n=1 Tax=Paraflavitalea devenefica TaxID=2716334 RepID=UPI00293B8BE5|nr:HopJ type III effector protein [Paraflavitalea devenefica]